MTRRNLLLNAAIAGMLAACSSAPTSSEDAELKSLKDAKIVEPPSTAAAEKGECHGINACKGKGECGGPGYSCAGNNSCKGKGWISLTEAECNSKKGQFKR